MSEKYSIDLTAISEKIRSAKSLEEVREIIEENGLNWEEFKTRISSDQEMTDDDLEAVSGGEGFFDKLWKALGGWIEDLAKDYIDRHTVETKNCTYSDDGNTRTCVWKTTIE